MIAMLMALLSGPIFVAIYSFAVIPVITKLPANKRGIIISIILAVPGFLPDAVFAIDEVATILLILNKIHKYNFSFTEQDEEKLKRDYGKINQNMDKQQNKYNNEIKNLKWKGEE